MLIVISLSPWLIVSCTIFKSPKHDNLEASNNLPEQAMRPLAIGRKNCLFSISIKGATANAIAYTIIQTAKSNGVLALNIVNHLSLLINGNYSIRISKLLILKTPNMDFIRNPDMLVDFLPWRKTSKRFVSNDIK